MIFAENVAGPLYARARQWRETATFFDVVSRHDFEIQEWRICGFKNLRKTGTINGERYEEKGQGGNVGRIF